MPVRMWPQSLFGRLLAASVAAVLLAQAMALVLIAQERERFVLQGSVREWTRRIADTTQMLAPLSATQRVAALARQSESPPAMHPPHMGHLSAAADPPPGHAHARGFLRLPLPSDFDNTLHEQLRAALGPGYGIEIGPTPEPAPPAVTLAPPFYEAHELALHPGSAQRYDVTVRFPDGDAVTYRVGRMPGGAPLPRNLFFNLTLLVLLLVIVLYLAARNITRPLSELAHAADSVGRDTRAVPPLAERGARLQYHAGPVASLSRQPHAGARRDVA